MENPLRCPDGRLLCLINDFAKTGERPPIPFRAKSLVYRSAVNKYGKSKFTTRMSGQIAGQTFGGEDLPLVHRIIPIKGPGLGVDMTCRSRIAEVLRK